LHQAIFLIAEILLVVKTLLVQSAFRSNASQLIVFLYFLRRNNFDLEKTAKRVAFPGYSEHGDPINPAIDFLDPENREMVTTEQYTWLLNNASKYGFYLSYPESNNFGIQFEPWHWRYKEE
jgi:D-alanyl-D-alanine carboxypeptidase